jgi:hypothetical protein
VNPSSGNPHRQTTFYWFFLCSPVLSVCCAAGIYTHSPEQLEEAGKYLEEKRAALKGVKIVTELEPINMYYKAEVGAGRQLSQPVPIPCITIAFSVLT